MAETERVTATLDSLQINGDQEAVQIDDVPGNSQESWGFPTEELYKIALKFYKEKEGSKAMSLTYKDRLRLVAYTKQVTYGCYRADVSPDVGFLDVVGNDRSTDLSEWQAWQALGEMSRDQAMQEFVSYLDTLCPLFRPYMQAHHADKEEQERKRQEEEEKKKREEEDRLRQELEQEARQQQQRENQKYIQQEVQIRTALNQQTAIQFKQYAEQQHPGNAEQQEVLIKQLQEQHFQQYMQQVYQQQLLHQRQQFQQLQAMAATNPDGVQSSLTDIQLQTGDAGRTVTVGDAPQIVMQSETGALPTTLPQNGLGTLQIIPDGQVDGQQPNDDEDNENDDENGFPPIAAASMWTRKDLKDFKDSLRKDPDSVIKVGSGETVTVRVPTHEDGTCLFWEFATDSYDVGFGVYFEWTISPSNQVSVHVSESSDEEDLEDEDGAAAAAAGGEGPKGDVEKGGSGKKDNRPPTDEIIPVYRRDCQEEVYCGSHMYPGRGVYLLKFDNSYSLWRSKTLYYRVYYTR